MSCESSFCILKFETTLYYIGDRKLIFHGAFDENILTVTIRLNLLKPIRTIAASSVAILSISRISK